MTKLEWILLADALSNEAAAVGGLAEHTSTLAQANLTTRQTLISLGNACLAMSRGGAVSGQEAAEPAELATA